jgi:hypothetical protein
MRKTACMLLVSASLLSSAIAAAQAPGHDLKITTRHTSGTYVFENTAYYSRDNSRTEMQISSGDIKGHHRAIIRRKNKDSIQAYDLDLEAREYVSYQTDLRGGVRGATPIAMKHSGKIYSIQVDTVDTGERQEMFGHMAWHLITKETRIGGPENCYGGNSEQEMDGWYIDYDVLPEQQRPRKSGVVIAHMLLGGSKGRCSDKVEIHRTGPATGFPLKETTTWINEASPTDATSRTTSISKTEVVEFVESSLDSALFQVPDGFRKVDEIVDPTQQPMQAMTYWERFKAEFRSIFH